jgi:hypothetical protein
VQLWLSVSRAAAGMVNGEWRMVNGEWRMVNKLLRNVRLLA